MSAPRRTQGERSDATREALVAATVSLIAERGLEGASLHEIADRAGVTKGAIVHHYEHKEALVDAALDRVAERIEAAVAEAWDPTLPPFPRVRRAAESLVGLRASCGGELRVLGAMSAAAAHDPRLRPRVSARVHGIEALVAQGLALTVAELGARSGVEPEVTARALVESVMLASGRAAAAHPETARFWERALVATIDAFVIDARASHGQGS